MASIPSLDIIMHPTTLDESDQRISACSVALASYAKAHLITLHASSNPVTPDKLPSASLALARWGKDPASVQQERLVEYCCEDIGETLLHYTHKWKPSLLVMGVRQQTRWQRILRGSISRQVVTDLAAPILLLPHEHADIFDERTGEVNLRSIVVAASDLAYLRQAGPWASLFAGMSKHKNGVIKAVHIGDKAPSPDDCLKPVGWNWEVELISETKAAIEDELIRATLNAGPNTLLIMATAGEDSLSDMLFGTHTERVIERLGRPVLVLPM